jgi:tyrosyl-tRNA synthetase
MGFIQDFIKRGYHYQCTNLDNLTSLMKTQKITAYIGFDCTAKSLHVGNLMQVMILRLLQQHGHKPIIIVGGATTKVGDPTGREETRKILANEELDQNIEGIKKSLSKFIKFGNGLDDAIMLNNSEWLESLNYINFLRDYGPLFSINRMLTMDSVKTRLEREQSLTFLEFNYMLLQAYDFYYLNKNYNCVLEFGGSDQWGNIVMGVDFIRKLTTKEAYGMTTPLLTTSSGIKMGKSLGGAVWLNEDMLSAYDYFQYWRNCEDLDIVKFAKLYAEFNEVEIREFEQLAKDDINSAKKQLAFTLTKLCHGQESAESALQTAIRTFEKREIDNNLPTIFINRERLTTGIPAYELFFEAGITDSKSESRRLIRAGGAKVNDQKIHDENMVIDSSLMLNNEIIKLSSGKKKHILVRYSV